jgi:hypothetical protein
MSLHAVALVGIAIPACLLFVGAVILYSRKRSLSSWLQLIGSAGLIMVVVTHFAEAFGLIPWMHWAGTDCQRPSRSTRACVVTQSRAQSQWMVRYLRVRALGYWARLPD